MEDPIAKCEIIERDVLFDVALKKGIVGGGGGGGGRYVMRLKFISRSFWKMGPDKRTVEEDGRRAQPTPDFYSPPPQDWWEDTLDKRGIERPDEK